MCDGGDLVQALDLPKLPLTGIYLDSEADDKYHPVDQALLLCRQCGHGQLLNELDPALVYGDTCTHRRSVSPIATAGNDFFLQFLTALKGRDRFRRVLEIGCNDLYLLRKLEPHAESLVGIDPIWQGRDTSAGGKLRVVGDFAERVDFESVAGEVRRCPRTGVPLTWRRRP